MFLLGALHIWRRSVECVQALFAAPTACARVASASWCGDVRSRCHACTRSYFGKVPTLEYG